MKLTGTRYINIKGTQQKSKAKKLSEIVNPKSLFDDNAAIVHLGDILTIEDKEKYNIALCKSQKRSKKSASRCYKKKYTSDDNKGEYNIYQNFNAYKINGTTPVVNNYKKVHNDSSLTEL